MAQAKVPVFFFISRYIGDKYFDIVWGCQPPGDSRNRPPKIKFLNGLSLDAIFLICRCLTDKYFDIVWGCQPPGNPPNGAPQNQFF